MKLEGAIDSLFEPCNRCRKCIYATWKSCYSKHYHPHCFTCAICDIILDQGKLADAESLKEVYCKNCHKKYFVDNADIADILPFRNFNDLINQELPVNKRRNELEEAKESSQGKLEESKESTKKFILPGGEDIDSMNCLQNESNNELIWMRQANPKIKSNMPCLQVNSDQYCHQIFGTTSSKSLVSSRTKVPSNRTVLTVRNRPNLRTIPPKLLIPPNMTVSETGEKENSHLIQHNSKLGRYNSDTYLKNLIGSDSPRTDKARMYRKPGDSGINANFNSRMKTARDHHRSKLETELLSLTNNKSVGRTAGQAVRNNKRVFEMENDNRKFRQASRLQKDFFANGIGSQLDSLSKLSSPSSDRSFRSDENLAHYGSQSYRDYSNHRNRVIMRSKRTGINDLKLKDLLTHDQINMDSSQSYRKHKGQKKKKKKLSHPQDLNSGYASDAGYQEKLSPSTFDGSESSLQCPICFEPLSSYVIGKDVLKKTLFTPCGHLMHRECLQEWINATGNCNCAICGEFWLVEECKPVNLEANIQKRSCASLRSPSRLTESNKLKSALAIVSANYEDLKHRFDLMNEEREEYFERMSTNTNFQTAYQLESKMRQNLARQNDELKKTIEDMKSTRNNNQEEEKRSNCTPAFEEEEKEKLKEMISRLEEELSQPKS